MNPLLVPAQAPTAVLTVLAALIVVVGVIALG
jgi:hypothetical protein